MAGDWIPIQLALPDKPEVHAMAGYLNLDPDTVVGKLVRVWAWFNTNSEDGNAFCNGLVTLDHVARCSGFGEAMLSVSWLKREKDRLTIPNWARHNGSAAKTRAKGTLRVKEWRSKQTENGNDHVTVEALQKRSQRTEQSTTTTTTTNVAGAPVDFEGVLAYAREQEATKECAKAYHQKRSLIDWTLEKGSRKIKITGANWKNDFLVFATHWSLNDAKAPGRPGGRGVNVHTLERRIKAGEDEIATVKGGRRFKEMSAREQARVEELRGRIDGWKSAILGDDKNK